MRITPLKDHAMLKRAAESCRDYLIKLNPKTKEDTAVASETESYAVETMISINNVVSCIDQLHYSVAMLSGYRAGTVPDKMNRYDYIVYGIENYYLRLTSIHDRCLRLANVIFQLGLPEKSCNNTTIIKNSHLKGSKVASSLKALDKFTDPFRFHRNTVAHEATYSEKDLNQLGAYHFLLDEDESFMDHRYPVKKMTDDFVVEKKTEFQGQLESLEELVTNYFDSLHPFFIQRLDGRNKQK